MQIKYKLRSKYFGIRKKNYFEINPSFFDPLNKLINRKSKNKRINLSSYYPSSYEVNTNILFETKLIKKVNIFLPIIKKNNLMYFFIWKKNDLLNINKFGMLEPTEKKMQVVPDIILVPLLAYDSQLNRLGYGGGFYDRYLNKYLSTYKQIVTVGVAFSFQKHNRIPISISDVKLNYILTEKGFV